MIRIIFMAFVLFVSFPVSVSAEGGDVYVLGTGDVPDQKTLDQINRTRAEALRTRSDIARQYYFSYGDDGLHIGRGLNPRYNYNRHMAAPDDVSGACQGLRERQYRRCVEDAMKAREKLQRKYRN